jgi:hypothetical protein
VLTDLTSRTQKTAWKSWVPGKTAIARNRGFLDFVGPSIRWTIDLKREGVHLLALTKMLNFKPIRSNGDRSAAMAFSSHCVSAGHCAEAWRLKRQGLHRFHAIIRLAKSRVLLRPCPEFHWEQRCLGQDPNRVVLADSGILWPSSLEYRDVVTSVDAAANGQLLSIEDRAFHG